MSHNHHNHNRTPRHNRSFAIGIILNTLFSITEAGFGIISNSMALVADAGHNFSDVLSLLLAWGASYLATKKPTPRRTYGFRRITILASIASGVLLLVAIGAITLESVERFRSPQQVGGMTIIVVAGIGTVINLITAYMFMDDYRKDLNIKGAYLHMLADAGVSAGVVISGIIIMITGWLVLDPLISILIVLVILAGTWGLLKDSINLAIDTVPKDINPGEVSEYLSGLPGVSSVHDLHIWAMSTTEVALTAHLIMPGWKTDDRFLNRVCEELKNNFGIDHSTIQIENGEEGEPCNQSVPESL